MFKEDRGPANTLRTKDNPALDPSIANELAVTMKIIKRICLK